MRRSKASNRFGTAQSPGNPLAAYLPRLELLAARGSGSTAGLKGISQAWQQAAQDPLFQTIQDQAVEDLCFQPAAGYWQELGLRSNLGLTILYDTTAQHGDGVDADGLAAIVHRTNTATGGTPAEGVPEKAWLREFLSQRRQTLLHAHNPAARRAWSKSVDRVNVLASVLTQNNAALAGPLAIAFSGDRRPSPENGSHALVQLREPVFHQGRRHLPIVTLKRVA